MNVLRTERAVAGGAILAHDDDGKVVFVRGALPGELVDVAITSARPRHAEADVRTVVEASPDRVGEPCEQRRAGCGGCDWMHIEPGRQLVHKVVVVADALRRTGGVAEPAVEIGGSVPSSAYRTTIRPIAGGDGRLGFRAHHSHEIVSARGCLIAHPTLVGLLEELDVTPGVEVTLRVSAATGELAARWDEGAGTVDGLPPATATGRRASIHEEVAGESLRVSADAFFQSGPAAAELLVDTVGVVAPELATAAVVLDAYSGVGVFARCAVGPAAQVLAIESSSAAAADTRRNRRDAAVHVGDVARNETTRFVAAHTDTVDVVIADPTRRGLGAGAVDVLAGVEAPVFVLVACDPAAFARDVSLLCERGYELARTVAVDLFPHTHHVEVVARFEHR